MLANRRKLLAQPQEARFGAHVVADIVPLRPADRAENDGIGGVRLRHRLLGDGDLMRIVTAAADKPFLGFERGNSRLGEEAKKPLYFGHHLRTDAVAGKEKKLVTGH